MDVTQRLLADLATVSGGAAAGDMLATGAPVTTVVLMCLHVAGRAPNAVKAIAHLEAICQQHLDDGYELEVVDVCEQTHRALNDGILVTPSLTKVASARGDVPGGFRYTEASRIAAMAQAAAPNRLLAALPAKEYERLVAGFEHVELTCGQVLYESGEPMRHVYFPSDCVVSLLTVVEGHRALEVGLVGREGMVGSRLALGITTASARALVQGTGTAVRIESVCFLRELHRSPMLRRALLLFTDALMMQITRTAACNRFHRIEARLARWLLMTRERLLTSEFYLTQEFLADMLGVRRAGVTTAACALQRQQLIRYRRGTITILDREGLQAAACSCYQHVKVTGLEAST
jgi:CRP-like cAMP-binding protein